VSFPSEGPTVSGGAVRARAVPAAAKVAAALFLVFGLAAVVNAVGAESDVGWLGGRMLPRAMVRLLASVVVAWGLNRGARWAWWLGLVAGLIWFVMSAAAVVVLDHGDLHWLQPSSDQLFLAISLVSLGLALALLLSRDVRATVHEPRR
jgi:hypothetical protein